MYRFLIKKIPRQLAITLTAGAYALILLLIIAKWGMGDGVFRYLNI